MTGGGHEPEVNAPGLGESRRAILAALKRSGTATIPELAGSLGLNVETVREHLKLLGAQGLVVRRGRRRARGPGRPEDVYGPSPEAEALFPRREAEVLRELAAYLVESGRERVLADFFERHIARRRDEALVRVDGLTGRERLEESARILTELGFMAVVEEEHGGAARLRLCHCPLRELVEATKIPCRAEEGLVRALVGERLARSSYIPAGDAACSYEPNGGAR